MSSDFAQTHIMHLTYVYSIGNIALVSQPYR